MKMPHWVCYILGVKCRNEEIMDTIQKYEEIAKRAEKAVDNAIEKIKIAALDGEEGWWERKCAEIERKKECKLNDINHNHA